MKNRLLAVSFACIGSFLLSACAPAFHQPLNAEQAATIKTIALIAVPNPAETLGGAELQKAGVDFSGPMTLALQRALQQNGYTVTIVPYGDRLSSEFISDYRAVPFPSETQMHYWTRA